MSRASLNSSKKEEKERLELRKSCHFFEVAAVQISGLDTLALFCQTSFSCACIYIFVCKPEVKTELLLGVRLWYAHVFGCTHHICKVCFIFTKPRPRIEQKDETAIKKRLTNVNSSQETFS